MEQFDSQGAWNLFDQNPYCKEFTATVLECQAIVNKEGAFYEIILSQTAFYPEGGGQPCDLGTLNLVPVLAVYRRETKVVHLVPKEIPVDTQVKGEIDWNRRFDLMQQHSGEHIFSGFAHSLFGCDNVGFHMGKETITVDFNVELDADQVAELEEKTNAYIWQSQQASKVHLPRERDLAELDFRAKKEISGAVRLIAFPDADLCACCGTHVAYASEIVLVKVVSFQKFRAGTRLELLFGKRALDYFQLHLGENQAISQLLSVKAKETSQAVEKLRKEKDNLHLSLLQMEQKYLQLLAQQQQGATLLFPEGISQDGLRYLATELAKSGSASVACFLEEDQQYRYALASMSEDVRVVATELNQLFQGKGGGKVNLAQGKLVAERQAIENYFANKPQ